MKSFSERYTLKTLLGQGGMGEVWYAWDNVLNQHVAIKMMHLKTSASPGMRKCFHREAEVCSLLHHPHIVEIYDYGTTEENRHYLSMELVCGCTLHELASSRLPLSAVIDLVCQILQALSHAHARGVVHRDLKAENVLVYMPNEQLKVKLVDFGLAALPQGLSDDDTRSSNLGTPGYMAPEQALHRSGLIGPATDIYAVGILLYEMLSGRLPFSGESALDTMRAQISAPVPSIDWHPHFEGLNPDIKSRLWGAVETALAKKTWQRFVSVEEFEAELKKIPCSREDYDSTSVMARLRQSGLETQIQISQEAFTHISQKIRAMKGADHSDAMPVIHLNENLQKSARFSKHPTALKLRQVLEQLKFAENRLGTDAIFYREILNALAVLGTEATMPEIEYFWRLDEDVSLADCWREALASWCSYGILTLHPAEPYKGQATMKVQFVEPELAVHLQSLFPVLRLRRLKSQAAMALLECYTEPTHEQMWRMAHLWYEANDWSSFAQMGAESAEQAFVLGEHEASALRFALLGQVFDSKIGQSTDNKWIQAIDWPVVFLRATQNAILLDDDIAFESYCSRLKAWVERTREFIWISHVRWLHALRHIRKENYQGAIEQLSACYEGFLKYGDRLQANRMLLLKADAEIQIGEPMIAIQTLREAQQAFAQIECDIELANVNVRLARLEWYAGNCHLAHQLASSALLVLDAHQAVCEKSQLQVWGDFVSFMAYPKNTTLYHLIASVSEVERYCDDVSSAQAQSCLLIAYAFCENWEEIDDILLRWGQRSAHTHQVSVLTGTISCIRALRFALQGDAILVEDELSLAIASFGPKNRRARAWCHALLGMYAILDADIEKGMQSFGRACKDFGLLGDEFGEITVVISKSALQAVCGRYHEAYLSSMHGLDLALESELHLHAAVAFAIAVKSSIHEPSESVHRLTDISVQPAIPAILRSYWLTAMSEALEHYSQIPEFETLTAKLQMLLNELSRMTAEEPSIGFPSLEIEI